MSRELHQDTIVDLIIDLSAKVQQGRWDSDSLNFYKRQLKDAEAKNEQLEIEAAELRTQIEWLRERLRT